MSSPCLHPGKALFAHVHPKGAKTRRGQLSWGFTGSKHPFLPLWFLFCRTVCSRRLRPSFFAQLFCQVEADQLQSRPV